MHLDEEQVQRLLHRELPPRTDIVLREHLGACIDCRWRVAKAEEEENEVYALLRHADHPPPRIGAEAIATRARDFGWVRWAAGFVLAAGVAGVAYAAPGSPVPGWIGTVMERIAGHQEAATSDQGFAGIAVNPGRALVILFTSPQAKGQTRVSLTDSADVVVRARPGAAIFTSDVERLVIDNRGSSSTFDIQIPRAAPRIEIRVGEHRIFLKDGARILTETSAETRGSYLLQLKSSGS